jgi:hypothetical protein
VNGLINVKGENHLSKRKPLSKKIRFEVFKRDNFKCQYCGKSAPDIILHVDHIKPVAEGGNNKLINLITSCIDCNQGKGKRKLSDSTIINKQKKEIEKLKEQKEQMEMFITARKELIELDNSKVDYLASQFEDGRESTVNDLGRKSLIRHLKKYGFDDVSKSIDIINEQYRDDEIAFNKIGGVCRNLQIEKKYPGLSDLYYIRGIMRNRYNFMVEWQAMQMLKELKFNIKMDINEIQDLVKKTNNWTEFKEAYEELIK